MKTISWENGIFEKPIDIVKITNSIDPIIIEGLGLVIFAMGYIKL